MGKLPYNSRERYLKAGPFWFYVNTVTLIQIHRHLYIGIRRRKGSVSAMLTRLSRNQEVKTKKMEPVLAVFFC